jgi:subtilisin family serine protease
VAAGNEGNDRIHWQGDLRNGVLEIPVEVRDPGFQFLDVWVPRGDDVDLVVVRPDGVVEDADGSIRQTPFGGYRAMPRLDPINRDQNLAFLIAGGNVGDVWKVRLTPIEVTQGVVHAWAGTETGAPGSILPDSGPEFSLGMPGTEERAIVVGSIVTRNVFEGPAGPAALPGLVVGRLSGFSSHGPTRTGAMKPDIAAPGQVITAALAAGSELATLPQFAARRHPSGQYVTIQGTSMATPFVAGVIALLLEGNSRLTPEEIQQRLRVTARRDTDTGRVWNPGFGFGKLDVATLLDYSQQLDSQP